jgi:hypothetical protein
MYLLTSTFLHYLIYLNIIFLAFIQFCTIQVGSLLTGHHLNMVIKWPKRQWWLTSAEMRLVWEFRGFFLICGTAPALPGGTEETMRTPTARIPRIWAKLSRASRIWITRAEHSNRCCKHRRMQEYYTVTNVFFYFRYFRINQQLWHIQNCPHLFQHMII